MKVSKKVFAALSIIGLLVIAANLPARLASAENMPREDQVEEREAAVLDIYNKLIADQAAQREKERLKHLKEQEFSRKIDQERGAEYAAEETERSRIAEECGSNYGNLKVGMKLSTAQKCVADFELVGQTKMNGATVSKYYRDRTTLYVKNGIITEWHRY